MHERKRITVLMEPFPFDSEGHFYNHQDLKQTFIKILTFVNKIKIR